MPEVIERFLALRQRLTNVREADGWLLAEVQLAEGDSEVAAALAGLHDDGVIPEVRREGRLLFPPRFEIGLLQLRIDTGQLPGYSETYDVLIESYPDEPPAAFHVWQRDDAAQAGYLAACKLLQLLKTKVEVWDATQRRFFLVDSQALEVPLAYHAEQTAGIASLLETVQKFLNVAHLDADVRWIFFRKASVRLLRDMPEPSRLGLLLANLGNVLERAQQDYALYLERFSFEDLLKTFDEKRLKFVDDLNQVLASIQMALVGVPLGFFLIAEQFKPSAKLVGQNLILALGGLLFFGLLFVLSLNQRKTLAEIGAVINDFAREQASKHTDKSPRLAELVANVRSQYRRVGCLLVVVHWILVAFATVVLAATVWCSVPALQSRFPYLPTSMSVSNAPAGGPTSVSNAPATSPTSVFSAPAARPASASNAPAAGSAGVTNPPAAGPAPSPGMGTNKP